MKTNNRQTWYTQDPLERDIYLTEWISRIPYIRFPSEWEIKPIPSVTGATARFRARFNGIELSIYLDTDFSLGYWDGPYWELYPYNDDTFRCGIFETDKLLAAMDEEFNRKR